jgi:hypothetical protein
MVAAVLLEQAAQLEQMELLAQQMPIQEAALVEVVAVMQLPEQQGRVVLVELLVVVALVVDFLSVAFVDHRVLGALAVQVA